MKAIKKIPKFWWAAIAGFLLGVLIVLTIRLITYDAGHVHYHANFAVYINGQQEEFAGSTYYEEVSACRADEHMSPEERTHMHDNVSDVVHVHAHAVTWGHFFENLGWAIGKDFVKTREAIYQNNDGSSLHIMLNGQNLTGISSITNQIIGNEDKLLLSFGNVSSDELQRQYQAIPDTAAEHNTQNDPAGCRGQSQTTISDRLRNLF